jgi:opacity protein-like surface antigen
MKRILLLAAFLTIISSSLYAGGPISFGLQATGATLNVPEPLKAVYGFGYGGGAHLDINLPVLFSIRIAADYTTYSPDREKFKTVLAAQSLGRVASGFETDGGRFNIFSASANGKLSLLPTPIISPYITAGAGIASVSNSDLTIRYQGTDLGTVASDSQTKAAINFGAGIDLTIVVTLYLEAKYTIIFTNGESSSFVPVSLGITF